MSTRLIMWNLVSLDGYFEGPNSDLSFIQYAWGPELESFINNQASDFGTIVFGRKTYDGMAAFWHDKNDLIGQIMNETPKVVFSKSKSPAIWRNSRVASGDLRTEVEKLKRESPKNAYLIGSGALGSQLARDGLIDEYRIGVVSLLLGKGTPLFERLANRVPLRLVETRPLGDKIVLLRFLPDGSKP